MNKNYSTTSKENILKELETTVRGLSEIEATRRLRVYGLNELTEGKKTTKLQIFSRQFKSALIGILIAAALISAFVGFYKIDPENLIDTGVIVLIIVLNAVLGFVQEFRAEKAMEALKRMASSKATVIRDKQPMRISSRNLVPGDVILLSTGDKVPADARVFETINLQVDESTLTGESVPVHKDIKILTKAADTPAEMKNMVFMNTIITAGHAKAIVTATGMKTQMGNIASMIQQAPEKKTPLQNKLSEIGKFLGIATILICFAVFGIEMLRGGDLFTVFMIAISLAVAAVPEGLPAVVTITLAVGLQKMAHSNAIVKRLPAVETLGCTDVICTDKTGTLTKNQMTVREIYVSGKTVQISGTGYEPNGTISLLKEKHTKQQEKHIELILRTCTLCNNATLHEVEGKWSMHGDPTEGALLTLAVKGGLDLEKENKNYMRIDELEFNSIKKRMTTINKKKEEICAFAKGAPEFLLGQCTEYMEHGIKKILTTEHREDILNATRNMAGRALRVLAIGYKQLPENELGNKKKLESNLVFLGLVGMIDPPRDEIKTALATCRKAGIRTVMVTGDHHDTAIAIGKEIGLFQTGDNSITGEELGKISDIELKNIIEKTSIFARVSPKHKVRILKALQANKHIVAMTGDGVNDAPALKSSDIGVAMGIIGTDVAKSAADMILGDDNFATIVKAVEEGRSIYDNIRKFLNYLLTSNAGEVLIIFVAALIGMPLPLLAVQLLWINLLTDGLPAVALAVDPPNQNIMERKPRNPNEKTISKRMIKSIGTVAVLMCIATLGLFKFVLWQGMGIDMARTVAVATIITLELVRVQAVRAEYNVNLTSNKWLWLALGSSLLLMFAIIYVPVLQTLFHTVALPLSIWTWIIGACLLVFILVLFKQKIEERFKK